MLQTDEFTLFVHLEIEAMKYKEGADFSLLLQRCYYYDAFPRCYIVRCLVISKPVY